MRKDGTRSGESLHALPKAEVHVHLEGCFEPATLESWARQAGVPMPRPRERLFSSRASLMSSNFWTGPVVSPALGTAWPKWPMGFVSDWRRTVPVTPT